MTNSARISKLFSVIMLVFLFFSAPVFAQMTPEEAAAEIANLDARDTTLKSEIANLKNQENSAQNEVNILALQSEALQGQLNSINAQINLATAKIDETNAQIKQANEDIVKQKDLLEEYVKVMYMDGQTSQIELILTSNSFSDFVDQNQYMSTMTQKIQDTTDRIIELQKKLESDKKALEVEKAKAEQLRAEQSTKKYALDSQIQQKDYLVNSLKYGQAVNYSEIDDNSTQRGLYECIARGGCRGDSGGALIVKNNIGTYFSQTDSKWNNYVYDRTFVNPDRDRDGNSGDEFWDVSTLGGWGCLITSLGMAHGVDPVTESKNHWYYRGGLQDNTAAVELGTNWNLIDQYLTAGRPVIAGLTMDAPYYTHFVLLKGINSDGTYLVNDPAFEVGTTYEKSRVFNAFVPF